jgi:hypothetical protein
MSLAGIAALLPALTGILERVVPNPNQRMEIQAELMKAALDSKSEFYKAAGSIITAEAQGESWMQRNWRPITMLSFVFIIVNNYILAPYTEFFTGLFGYAVTVPVLEIPEGLWGLLQIGIGGYIASRGVEKVTESVQRGQTPIIGSRNSGGVSQQDLERSNQRLLDELRNAG